MNYADMETYLELVQTRNITKAAEHMHLSQSTVSNRLKNLENEVGFQLFIRGKGRQSIELTRKGEDFVTIVERWKSLYEETELLKSTFFSKLRIAVNESSYFTLICPFILAYGKDNPQLRFDVHICDSEQIYDLTEKGLIHFGFVSYESDHPRLVREEIEHHELCIVMHAKNSESESRIDPATLDPLKEIRFSGGRFSSMDRWRQKWFGTANEASLTINVGAGAIPHLQQAGAWAIVPVNMARFLSRYTPLQVFTLQEPIDPWQIYMIRRKDVDPKKQELFKDFTAKLIDYVTNNRKSGG
ncbi:MAG: LysR family transcriptional regulator [Pyramidobacter sp.]|uniref:LysR family transcriptional regulator n=1 Tax=Pyramidobacter sp. TaxID=1943581 RepID=UPI002A81929D|nr:LysR family transcriptional regulator [Pyramidobacter sp.]MDY4031901.1 LysR family transcriptional regulator [Pyramidobacter sp.]